MRPLHFSLLFSSLLYAFYYSLCRTNGSIFKSILFTIYFLAIKFNIICVNGETSLKFDQYTQDKITITKVIPVYNVYDSIFEHQRSFKLYMEPFQNHLDANFDYLSSSSKSVIEQTRSGDLNDRIRQAAWLLITIWLLQPETSDLFNQRPLPPNFQQIREMLLGKPKFNYQTSRLNSVFDKDSEKNSRYSKIVRDRSETIRILNERFGSLENPKFEYIDESIGLTANLQQLALKIYHAKSYKVYPELYGMSSEDLEAIIKYGLPGYVDRGGKLPPEEAVSALLEHVKTFYSRNKANINYNASFRGDKVIAIHNTYGSGTQILIFDPVSKKLRLPHEVSRKPFERYLETGIIGNQTIPPAEGTTPPPNLPQDKTPSPDL